MWEASPDGRRTNNIARNTANCILIAIRNYGSEYYTCCLINENSKCAHKGFTFLYIKLLHDVILTPLLTYLDMKKICVTLKLISELRDDRINISMYMCDTSS